MKRLICFALVCLLVLGALGCAAKGEPIKEYEISVAFAGSVSAPNIIYTMSLNRERSDLSVGVGRELPIYRLDQQKDVAWFYETFGTTFDLEHDHELWLSFQRIVSKYDKAFFSANSLMLVYVHSGVYSLNCGFKDISCDGKSFYIDLEPTNSMDFGFGSMSSWFIIVAVPDELVDDCTEFGARYVGKSN